MIYLKRYSVDIGGRLLAAFDTEQEAREWLDARWWYSIATIYDHEKQETILTEVRL